MEFKQIFTVLGVKKFKGLIEGQHFDNTKLHVAVDTSERNGTEVGQCGASWPFKTSAEFDKIFHLPFPLQAELTINLTNKGPEVLEFRHIEQVKPAKAA
jgi:hypothetical protein